MSSLHQIWRQKLIDWLRPGQDEEELLEILQRAECLKSDEQRQMLIQAIDFHDTRVREIMTPRSEIHAIDIGISDDELEQEMLKSRSVRLPVTDGDLDHIIGVVHLWDLFSAKLRGENIALQDFLRPCPKISELQRVAGLLSEMREGSHIAIAQDEFGGTAGLVTLPDLLAEIVGSFGEGTKAENTEITHLENGAIEVMARVHIDELEEAMGMSFPEGDFDTVGGLITSDLGRIPMANERINIANMDITVLEADPRRIVRVKIHPTPE